MDMRPSKVRQPDEHGDDGSDDQAGAALTDRPDQRGGYPRYPPTHQALPPYRIHGRFSCASSSAFFARKRSS
jgi:hypothetical protein